MFNLGIEESKGQPVSDEKLTPGVEPTGDIVEFKTEDGSKKAGKLNSKYSLDYIFTKKTFKRIVKWAEEDSSSIWYDHLEQETAEFTEIKNSYKTEIQKGNVETAETERLKNYKQMVSYYEKLPKEGKESQQLKFLIDYKANYGEIFPNPQFHQCLIKQRQQTDKWGRKILIKPNRNIQEGSHFKYYKYLAQEYLHKMFAVSLLEDTEQTDGLIPQSQTDYMLDTDQQEDLQFKPNLRKTESMTMVTNPQE